MQIRDLPYQTVEAAALQISVCCCNGMGYVRMPVAVGHPLFGKAVPCVCKQSDIAKRDAERLRAKANVSSTILQQHTFSAFSAEACRALPGEDRNATIKDMRWIKDKCQNFSADPQGWLSLIGPVGCGKTHLAHAIVGEVLAKGIGCYWGSVPAMLKVLRKGYNDGSYDQMLDWLLNVSVMVLDDLGAERDTDWVIEQMFQIINHRYEERLPLVITSNSNLADAKAAELNARLRSRLADRKLVTTLTLPAADFRLKDPVR